MTQKFKLGATPKNFQKNVEVVLHDGSVAKIAFTYTYRNRIELAELLDEKFAADSAKAKAAKEQAEAAAEAALNAAEAGEKIDAPLPSVAELVRKDAEERAEFTLRLAEGWDLDEPFTKEKLVELEYRFPGTLGLIEMTYRKAVMEHRAKN
ncbi:phage tail assembly chaperone [Oxalobacteraceae bacterium A2-2]